MTDLANPFLDTPPAPAVPAKVVAAGLTKDLFESLMGGVGKGFVHFLNPIHARLDALEKALDVEKAKATGALAGEVDRFLDQVK